MEEVVQHLEAALAAVETHLTESELFQDLKNRLMDVKNHAESAVKELTTSEPTDSGVVTPPAPQSPPANGVEGQPADPTNDTQASNDAPAPTADAEQVTNEDGTPVTDPNAAR